MNKSKTILAILVSMAVTAGLVCLVLFTKGTSSAPKRPQSVSIPTVKTENATKKTLHDYVITNGEVESQSSIEVFPSMSGKIAAINVMLGSSVKKGDVIAKVDPSEPGTNYALSPVEAPISGSIVSSPLKIGTKVSTATAITMIGDIENLQVTASVPERYVAELKTGLKAEVYLEAYPGVVFTATVSRVSPVVDAATRTKEIILNFDKKDSRINAGMFAKVKLFIAKYAGHIAIPKDAVVEQDENSYL
ncbi:MAG: efflux RND transporter periplasmic adaptor subunit, partial [Treponema sp.]|nr:efflux RND transporter periplasmic adaptor subunit [Treponema sp.]